MFISYAQNCEDIVLWRVLGHVEHGTYVDVGAADPTEYSVTKAFYDRGWSGVNVEPAPEFAAALAEQRDRDINVAMCAGDVVGPITLHYVPGTGLSTVADDHLDTIADQKFEIVDIETEVKRLDSILADAGLAGRDIHFLKIDVEGAEESVLRSVDLSVWRPWIVVVEATEPTTTLQNHHVWEPLLLAAGYQFCLFDGLNRFYLASDHSELAATLSYPAGVFDQPYTVGAGQNELAARAEAVILERDELAASYARLESELQRSIAGYEALSQTYGRAIESYNALHAKYDDTVQAFEELDARHLEAIAGYVRLEGVYQHTLESYDRLHAEYDRALAAYQRLDAERGSLVSESERLRSENADLSSALTSCQQGLEVTRAESQKRIDALESEIHAIKRSRSWKVTRPLRALSGKR